jgi:hypothetical protein
MRWGFKSQAERLSLDLRAGMGLAPTDPLDPFELARRLEIPVLTFDECGRAAGLDNARRRLLATAQGRVCALTVCHGRRRAIIYNDRNARTRQVSDVAHELAHTLLKHEPTSLAHADRYADRDPRIEEEASYQGGALLVPRDGALELLGLGMTDDELAEHYGVSPIMARWRCEATGVKIQLGRAGRRRRGRNARP